MHWQCAELRNLSTRRTVLVVLFRWVGGVVSTPPWRLQLASSEHQTGVSFWGVETGPRAYLIKAPRPYLNASRHGPRRLPRDGLGQVPHDAFQLHDQHGRLRVVRVVVDLATDLVLVLTCSSCV